MGFSAVPLGQKFTAVLLAAAVGGGVYSYYRHNAMEAASAAELSFDMHAARRIDAGLVQSHDPGVIFAESVLSDQKLADLSKSAYLSTSAMMSRVGEFRSRLVLTQPSAQVVRVRFVDPDPAKAADAANTVANALASWGPSPNGPAALTEPAPMSAPAAAAKPQTPAATPAPKVEAPKPAPPARKPVDTASNEAAGSLATALGGVQSQLATLSRQVEEGGSSSRGRAYAQSEQQQLLKSQVRAAESKVADLRAKASGEDKQRLGQIQQALSGILAGGGVGVSAGQLRREREALTRALAVVEQQHEAVEKEASARSGSDSASEAPAPAPPAPDTSSAAKAPAAASGSSPIAESDVGGSAAASSGSQPAPAAQSAPAAESLPDGEDAAMQNPLHVVRLAGTAASPIWWPAAAAGFAVGFLYWLIAAARSGSSDYAYADVEEGSSHYGRFITPDAPAAPSFVPAAEPVARDFVARDFQARDFQARDVQDRGGSRRASFTYEPSREERERNAVGATVPGAEPIVAPEPKVEPEPPVAEEAREEPSTPFHEKVVEMDPWADLMQKALSETEIGKKFESPKDRSEEAAKDASRRPDRLAG